MARRGRPPGGDSAETRKRIIESARRAFASNGFEGTSISAVAANAELAPSAVYHYFGSKWQLYEAVFDETAAAIWTDIDEASHEHETLVANIESLAGDSRSLSKVHPFHNDFLALVPMEARLHPELSHLMDRRAKYQDRTFGALAELGLSTGELRGFTVEEATEMLRSLVMGWFFERYFRGGEQQGATNVVVATMRALAERTPSASDQ